MNETARKLMKRIDDASFAMDDVILYLDTPSRMRWKLHSGGELFFRIWICRL